MIDPVELIEAIVVQEPLESPGKSIGIGERTVRALVRQDQFSAAGCTIRIVEPERPSMARNRSSCCNIRAQFLGKVDFEIGRQ